MKLIFYISASILVAALFIADFSYIWGLDFSFTNDSIGPFIFLISGYLIFLNYKRIKEATVNPQPFAMLGVIAAILLYLAALRAELPQAYHVAFIVFTLSSILYLFGAEVTKPLLFPVAYTFFVIPIDFIKESIGVPLRFFVSVVSTGLFNILGMKAARVGTSIYMDFFSFDIAAPCSGINSLISLLALAAVFAYLTEKSNIKRLILFVSAIPIAVAVNIIRVTSIGLVAKGFSKDLAMKAYHDYSGYFLFIFSLGLLFLEKRLLDCIGKRGANE